MRRTGLAALGAALLTACAHAHVDVLERDVSPVTYQPVAGAKLERTTGRLRRLAVVVEPFESSPRNPRWCLDPCDAVAYQRAFAARALETLHDWRGYEVVPAEDPDVPDVDGVLVLRARLVSMTWLDAASWLVTLTFSVPLSMARVGPRAEAEITERASGRVVWRSHVRGNGDTTGVQLADALLDPLELAWPRALAREPAPQP